ncbi:MAG: hypothetical protein PF447_03825 [Spirochaetaceae bacterium]|jgi:uncharacterized membrane protein HdeD (DUF308 family)|nr:hypothetical protein [Spirochaetaceae bacterium]
MGSAVLSLMTFVGVLLLIRGVMGLIAYLQKKRDLEERDKN